MSASISTPAESSAPQSVAQTSPMVAATLCAARRVSGWSHGAERLLGWSADEIIGRPLASLISPERNARAELLIARLQNGEFIAPLESEMAHKDGGLIRIEFSPTAMRENGLFSGVLLILRDTDARERAERLLLDAQERAAQRTLILEAANRVANDIVGASSGLEALRHIAEAARVLAGARHAALGVAGREGEGLRELITVGIAPERADAMGARLDKNSVLGALLGRETPLRLDSIQTRGHEIGFPARHGLSGSFLGVPIRRGERVLGSLCLAEKESGGAFTEADEFAVSALTAHAAVAIHNLHMLERQRALVSSFIRAQEDERRAIAYDLHDGLTQYVMASQAHLDASSRAYENGKLDKARREFETGTRYLDEAVLESRRMINGLRLLALEDLGLCGALEQLLRDEETRAGWDAQLNCDISRARFEKEIEIGLYRVAQEALTNVRKHASAERVAVKLWTDDASEPSQLHLEVRDWGAGFDPDEVGPPSSHVGLHGMSERVHVLGGTFEVESKAGQGTTVRAGFPI